MVNGEQISNECGRERKVNQKKNLAQIIWLISDWEHKTKSMLKSH